MEAERLHSEKIPSFTIYEVLLMVVLLDEVNIRK